MADKGPSTHNAPSLSSAEGFAKRWLFRFFCLLPMVGAWFLVRAYNRSVWRSVNYGCEVIGGWSGGLFNWASSYSTILSMLNHRPYWPLFFVVAFGVWLFAVVLVGRWARRASLASKGYFLHLGLYVWFGVGLVFSWSHLLSLHSGSYASTPFLRGWDNRVPV